MIALNPEELHNLSREADVNTYVKEIDRLRELSIKKESLAYTESFLVEYGKFRKDWNNLNG